MNKLIVLLAIVFATLSTYSCKEKQADKEASHEGHNHEVGDGHNEAKALTYKCKMDCEKGRTYDAKGKCPVCKMDLVEAEAEAETHEDHDHPKDENHKDHNH